MTSMSKVAITMMAILIVLLATVLGLWVWTLSTGRSVSHEQILDRQQRVEAQLTYISCLLVILPTERTPEAVASCQVNG